MTKFQQNRQYFHIAMNILATKLLHSQLSGKILKSADRISEFFCLCVCMVFSTF